MNKFYAVVVLVLGFALFSTGCKIDGKEANLDANCDIDGTVVDASADSQNGHVDAGVDTNSVDATADGGTTPPDCADPTPTPTPEPTCTPTPAPTPTPTPAPGDNTDPANTLVLQTPATPTGISTSYRTYYFRTTNTQPINVKSFKFTGTGEVIQARLYFTATDVGTPGTVYENTTDLALFNNLANNTPTLVYSARTSSSELVLPTDDGTGKPVARVVPANQAGFIEIEYVYTGQTQSVGQAKFELLPYAAGVSVTPAATFTSYYGAINVAPNAVGDVESVVCTVPATAKFSYLTMIAHKHAVDTRIKNGFPTSTDITYQTSNFMNPPELNFTAANAPVFAAGKMTIQCTYDNVAMAPNFAYTIHSGRFSDVDEECIVSGYYFPAPAGVSSSMCYNGFGLDRSY